MQRDRVALGLLLVLLGVSVSGCLEIKTNWQGTLSDDPGALGGLAGTYFCESVTTAHGTSECDTTQPLVLGEWFDYSYGTHDEGTYEMMDGQVWFYGPEGQSSRSDVYGRVWSWGPATLDEGALVWDDGDRLVRWVRFDAGGASPLAGEYVCMRVTEQETTRCQTSGFLTIQATGAWDFGTDQGMAHLNGDEVRFESDFGTGPPEWGDATFDEAGILQFYADDRLVTWERVDRSAQGGLAGAWYCETERAPDGIDYFCDWTDHLVLDEEGTWTTGGYEGEWGVVTEDELFFHGTGGPTYWGFVFFEDDVLRFYGDDDTVLTWARCSDPAGFKGLLQYPPC